MHERLEQYERLLQNHGIRSSETVPASQNLSPTDRGKSEATPPDASAAFYEGPLRTGKLLAGSGKSRYIDSPLWNNLTARSEEQFHPSEDEEDDEPSEQAPLYDAAGSVDPVSATIFGSGSPNQSLLDHHPTYDHAMKLWKMYCQNVDPLIKIIHIPTGLTMIQRAAANPSSISKSTECLAFAIYHFAVQAMTEGDCQEQLGQSRNLLRGKYLEATKQALLNSSFLRTTDMVVLQAFALFLISTRTQTSPDLLWIMTGVCLRIAQRMGLHRDGEQLGLKPFDVQLRRRLYWQLLPLDGLAAQLSGTGIAAPSGGFDTKPPLNVNDTDLWPDMTETPVERKGATDMIFCLLRAEIGKFHQRMKPWTGGWARIWQARDASAAEVIERAMDELENIVEEKFLRYIDFVLPIHCLAQAMARTALAAGRFRVRLPFVNTNPGEADAQSKKAELFDLAMRVVDYDIAVHTNPAVKRFEWHLQSYFQWEALIFMLDCLRQQYAFIDAQTAWVKIEEIYRCHPEWLAQRRSLHVALGKLTLRAWDARPAEQKNPELTLIHTLRQGFAKVEAPKTVPPHPTYNPFAPLQDGSDDLPLPDMSYVPDPTSGVDFSLLNGFNPDTMDWMFWDQMIKDQQDGYPTA